jgi:hypothetical protein
MKSNEMGITCETGVKSFAGKQQGKIREAVACRQNIAKRILRNRA